MQTFTLTPLCPYSPLPHPFTSYAKEAYIIRYNIEYLCRTMPRRILAPLLQDIHDCQKHFLEQLIGKPLTPLQWTKPNCPLKRGVLAL